MKRCWQFRHKTGGQATVYFMTEEPSGVITAVWFGKLASAITRSAQRKEWAALVGKKFDDPKCEKLLALWVLEDVFDPADVQLELLPARPDVHVPPVNGNPAVINRTTTTPPKSL